MFISSPSALMLKFAPAFLSSILILSCASQSPELLTARAAFDNARHQKAYDNYSKHLEQHSYSQEAKEKLAILGRLLSEQALKDAEASLAAVPGPLSVPAVEAAIKILDGAARYDSEGRYLNARRAEYRNKIAVLREENNNRAAQALNILKAGNLGLAREVLFLMQSIDARSETVKDVQARYSKLYAEQLEPRLRSLLDEGSLLEARAELEKLADQGVDQETAGYLTGIFKDYVHSTLHGIIAGAIAGGKWYKAHLLIEDSGEKEFFSDFTGEIQTRGAAHYLSQARLYLNKKQYSRAYLEAFKGFELNADLIGIKEIQDSARHKVQASLQSQIAVIAFNSPGAHPEAGPKLADITNAGLAKILPCAVSLVERQKVEALTAGKRRELKEGVRLLKADMAISGDIALLRVNQLEEAAGKVIKAFALASLEIFDARTGAGTINRHELKSRFEAFGDRPDSSSGSAEPSLELPSEEKAKDILLEKLAAQAVSAINQYFAPRRAFFTAEAAALLARKENVKAFDALAQGLLCALISKPPTGDQHFVALRELIIQSTE